MVEFLFLDLDDTILDFQKAERIAMSKTLREFGVEPTEQVLARYMQINVEHWKKLERKELTRDQVVFGRFEVFFDELGVAVDAKQVALRYEELLSIGHYFLPGAEKAVISLSKKYKLYMASNGTAKVQAGRLASANISQYFQKIFVSQECGAYKPDKEYFDRCARQIPGFDPARAIMVGDSLTSDIQGGINAGMRTVWVNPRHLAYPDDIVPDYQIEALSELEQLLETI